MTRNIIYARSPLPGIVELCIGRNVHRLTLEQIADLNEHTSKALRDRLLPPMASAGFSTPEGLAGHDD